MPIEPGPLVASGFDAVGLGLNNIDILAVVAAFPSSNGKYPLQELVELPGGQTASALVACSRLGWRACYIGSFGNDARGMVAKASLISDGVNVSECRLVDAPQALSLVLVDGNHRRTVLWHRPSELDLGPEHVDERAVTAGRILLVDCYETAAATQAADFAHRRGLPTVIDVDQARPGLAGLLEKIDIVIADEAFPEAFFGGSGVGSALARMVKEFRPAVACATLGRKGSLTRVEGHEIFTPAFDVPVVDSTGAGDAFRGGFIAGWLQAGANPLVEDVLLYASAVAALQPRGLGARTAMPSREEVTCFLRDDKSL